MWVVSLGIVYSIIVSKEKIWMSVAVQVDLNQTSLAHLDLASLCIFIPHQIFCWLSTFIVTTCLFRSFTMVTVSKVQYQSDFIEVQFHYKQIPKFTESLLFILTFFCLSHYLLRERQFYGSLKRLCNKSDTRMERFCKQFWGSEVVYWTNKKSLRLRVHVNPI